MQDLIVQTKTCLHCKHDFDITQGDLDFYDKVSPTFAGQKFQIPTPTLCPDCRQRRRLSFRNERKLYRRICDATQQPIISIYSPDKPYKVYDQKTRRSDGWDPMDYGFEFDFSKSFTENFKELMMRVPRISLFSQRVENSEYSNQSYDNKNCYMCFAVGDCENILYSTYVTHNSNCIDLTYCHNCENCYQSINCDRCYNIFNCFFMKDCRDCYYSHGCIGCNNLINCLNLSNQSYCIDNKQYSREEFDKYKELFQFKSSFVKGNEDSIGTNINSISSTGEFLLNAKDSTDCMDVFDIEKCSYSKRIFNSNNCYDCYGMGGSSFVLEGIGVENLIGSFVNTVVSNSLYMFYSDLCFSSSNLFGCVGLRNKQYCIFNKQYSKEEYEIQVAKIIQHMMTTGEWGEFFHPSLSPFGYNETVAQEYYPLEVKGQRLYGKGDKNIDFSENGYHRSSYEAPAPHSDKVINGEDLPSTITEVEDSILQYAIKCEVTGKLFRIQPQELAFYRKHNIPLPRKHPDQRHLERLALRK